MEWTESTEDDLEILESGDYLVRECYAESEDEYELFQWGKFYASGTKVEMMDLAEELDHIS